MPQDDNAVFQDIRNGLYLLKDEALVRYFGRYQPEANRLRRLLERRREPREVKPKVEKLGGGISPIKEGETPAILETSPEKVG